MKGYAKYKRIKNDHLSVPMAEENTGRHLGLVKKVRLTVKLTRADNFDDIIAMEEEAERKAKGSRGVQASVGKDSQPIENAQIEAKRYRSTDDGYDSYKQHSTSTESGNPDSGKISHP